MIDSPCTHREKHMSAAGELQEDLHDLAVVAERREELTIEFSEFRKRYEEGKAL